MASITEVFIPYGGSVAAQLPPEAIYIGASDNSGFAVGGGSGFILLFHIPDGATAPIARTFRAHKKGDNITDATEALRGNGWFQRSGAGAVTRFAVYEAV